VTRANGHGRPADLFQTLSPTARSVRNDHVDVSEAKLFRPSLLCRVGQYGDLHPGPRGPCSWGQFESWLRPVPFKGRAQQPLGESAQSHFWLVVPISAA
jgi:hypothetical protein